VKNICIDGPIGAGKSTILNILNDATNKQTSVKWEMMPEPVERWVESGILNAFYTDLKKYSYMMQSVAFIDRVRNLQKPTDADIRICERSPMADRNCFAKNCRDTGLMTSIEWNEYVRWFDWLSECFNLDKCINGYVYLRCSPETSFDRINKRNRSAEKTVSLEYLTDLNKLYEEWIDTIPKENVLVIDADRDFLRDNVICDNYINQIINFCQRD